MRERIAALPDGEYRYGLTIDGFEQPIEIRAAVRVHGDELTVDFAGSSGPVPLGVNVALNYTRAYTTYGIKCVISPDVPNNEGSFRPVHVTAPEGSILNARFPAAVAGRHLVGHFLPSAVMGALAQALPEPGDGAGLRRALGHPDHGRRARDEPPLLVHLVLGGRHRRAPRPGRALGHRVSERRRGRGGRGDRDARAGRPPPARAPRPTRAAPAPSAAAWARYGDRGPDRRALRLLGSLRADAPRGAGPPGRRPGRLRPRRDEQRRSRCRRRSARSSPRTPW